MRPLEPRDGEEEDDTLIEVLSADITDAYDFGDPGRSSSLSERPVPAASGTVRVASRSAWEDADTGAYKDGELVELLTHQPIAAAGALRAGGKGGQ